MMARLEDGSLVHSPHPAAMPEAHAIAEAARRLACDLRALGSLNDANHERLARHVGRLDSAAADFSRAADLLAPGDAALVGRAEAAVREAWKRPDLLKPAIDGIGAVLSDLRESIARPVAVTATDTELARRVSEEARLRGLEPLHELARAAEAIVDELGRGTITVMERQASGGDAALPQRLGAWLAGPDGPNHPAMERFLQDAARLPTVACEVSCDRGELRAQVHLSNPEGGSASLDVRGEVTAGCLEPVLEQLREVRQALREGRSPEEAMRRLEEMWHESFERPRDEEERRRRISYEMTGGQINF